MNINTVATVPPIDVIAKIVMTLKRKRGGGRVNVEKDVIDSSLQGS